MGDPAPQRGGPGGCGDDGQRRPVHRPDAGPCDFARDFRSGATISAALYLGVERSSAGRFSFLLSLPAIVGALLLEIRNGAASSASTPALLLGGAVAAATGWLALVLLLRIVKNGHLHRFAPYCWALGAGVLLWRFVL